MACRLHLAWEGITWPAGSCQDAALRIVPALSCWPESLGLAILLDFAVVPVEGAHAACVVRGGIAHVVLVVVARGSPPCWGGSGWGQQSGSAFVAVMVGC